MSKITKLFDKSEQDSTLQDYVIGLKLSKDEARALHMFFSPHRIPVGLDDTQARVCIQLCVLRDVQRDIILKQAIDKEESLLLATQSAGLISLPEEFLPHKKMSKRRFWLGVQKFLTQLTKL